MITTTRMSASTSRFPRRALTMLVGASALALTSLSTIAASDMPPLPEVKGAVVEGDGNDYTLKYSIGTTESGAQYRGSSISRRSSKLAAMAIFRSNYSPAPNSAMTFRPSAPYRPVHWR